MELIFLGTGGTLPTKKRGLPSVVLRRGAELLMFDCGECTQRQMAATKLGFNRLMKLFISHMHGDHVLGLPGLLQSMSFLGRERKLEIYGPEGITEFIDVVNRTVKFNQRFTLEVNEIKTGIILDEKEYTIEATGLEHGTPCFGFALAEKSKPGRFNPAKARALRIPEGPLWKRLQIGEKIKLGEVEILPSQVLGSPRTGLKVAYVTDTRPCAAAIMLARKADVLMYDCTFDSSKKEKAMEYGHSTAEQAAHIAEEAGVGRLVLLHISSMYEDATPLLAEAKSIFKRTTLARDFMRLTVGT